jgi:hypothetical protein
MIIPTTRHTTFCIRCFDELLFGDVEAACITPLTPLLDTDGGAASTILLVAPFPLLDPLPFFDFFLFFFLAPLDEEVLLSIFSAVSSGVLGGTSIILFVYQVKVKLYAATRQ